MLHEIVSRRNPSQSNNSFSLFSFLIRIVEARVGVEPTQICLTDKRSETTELPGLGPGIRFLTDYVYTYREKRGRWDSNPRKTNLHML
jgi:hypothetical protein